MQEELEQVFLNREELKKQLAAAEQAKAAADKTAADNKAKAEAAEKAKAEAEKGKLAAEQGKAAAEQGKAAADKAAAEANAKAVAAEKAKAEAEKGKLAAEQGKAAAEQGKAAADKTASEATKKAADLAAQLQSSSATLPEQTKVLKEAQDENDLLLKQLHQVQEELESYFIKHQEAQSAQASTKDRLERVLMRLPAWADAETITAKPLVNEAQHRCMRVEVHTLWVGQDAPVPKLGFLLGTRDGVPYMEFRPGESGVPKHLLQWPEAFKDEQGDRLLLAPGAPGALGQAQTQVVSALKAAQWRLVKGLLVLVGSQVNRLNLREQADRVYVVNLTRDLTQSLDGLSSGVHFESAEIMAVTQPVAGTEVMRVAIRDLNIRNTRVPMCVLELGIQYKTLKSGPAPQVFFMDFRPWKGAVLPFASFKPNSQDEQGEFLRISVSRTGRSKNSPPDLGSLEVADQQMIVHLGAVLQHMLGDVALKRFKTALGHDVWLQEVAGFAVLLSPRNGYLK